MAGRDIHKRLQALDAAFKSITVGDFGGSVLQPTAFNRFIRILQEKNNILQNTRRISMPTQTVRIDRTGFMERVLRAGDAADGTHKVLVQSEYAKPAFEQESLTAFEVQGITAIYDKALRRNIERKRYVNTLLDGFTGAVGRDLEELFLFMDSVTNPAVDLLLSKGNGWIKKATNKVYGMNQGTGDGTANNAARNFDAASTDANTGFPRNMFQAMLVTLPKQYFQDPSEWVLYVPWEVMDAYREQMAKRIGSTADSALVDGRVNDYKGIKVEYAPMLNKYKTPAAGGTGRVSMLQHPNNMSWGVFEEVTVEPSRHPEERRTAYVVTAEVDAGYEDRGAAVIALVDKAKS